jgi:hypothetical protein
MSFLVKFLNWGSDFTHGLLGIHQQTTEEAEIDAFGVGAVMPYDLSSIALGESCNKK